MHHLSYYAITLLLNTGVKLTSDPHCCLTSVKFSHTFVTTVKYAQHYYVCWTRDHTGEPQDA